MDQLCKKINFDKKEFIKRFINGYNTVKAKIVTIENI